MNEEYIQADSSVPKYQQIADRVVQRVKTHTLRKGDPLPSINQMCKEEGVSRDTVVKAYEHLKRLKLVDAVHGKGVFIARETLAQPKTVLLILDEMSMYKADVADALRDALGGGYYVETFAYNHNIAHLTLFLDAIRTPYDALAFIPPCYTTAPKVTTMLADKAYRVFFLDRAPDKTFPSVTQDFAKGTYDALCEYEARFTRYARARLLVPSMRSAIIGAIERGMKRFAKKAGQAFSRSSTPTLEKDTWHLVIDDTTLIESVKYAKREGIVLGRDAGLLSYNEMPFKDVVDKGVSVISCDFNSMGRTLAAFIQKERTDAVVIPTRIIMRQTL